MADSQGNNGGRLRRNISKIAFRNKERVMRSIGRAEETKDEILDHYVMLINKQQIQMQKLQRDMKQYLQALKVMSISQKAFYNSLYEVYDDDWAGKDVVASCSQRNETLYDDIFARFQSEVLELLQNHLSEYQKCKGCVEKCGRKLVDYDAAKRTLHVVESSKRPDPARLEKSKENLRQTREIYEELNNFLHQQLPTLYDSRLSVCVNIFSSICESESMFSSEVAELRTKLNTVLLNLKSAFNQGEYHIQRMQTPLDNGRTSDSPGSRTTPPMKVPRGAMEHEVNIHNSDTIPAPRTPSENDVVPPSTDPSTHEYVNLQVGSARESVKPVSEEEELGSGDSQSNNKTDEHMYMIPNVPYERRHSEYMMASELVCLARRSPPVGMSFSPKPTLNHHIFRNPSDRCNIKPPIPKPLPRALSAPPGHRPVVKRHPKPPRRPNLKFSNLHQSRTGLKATSTTLEDRPKKNKRPASMFVPASAGKLSVHKKVAGGTKDDGSGSVDKGKETDASNEEKTSKGFFGLLGLRRSRSSKNINSVPLSVASKEKATPKEATSKDSLSDVQVEKTKQADNVENRHKSAVGVVVAASAAVAVSSHINTNEQQENHPEERTDDEIGPSTTQEKSTNDDSDLGEAVGEAVKYTAEVEYAQIQRAKSEEEVEDVFLKMRASEDAPSHVYDNAKDDEAEVPNVGDESSEHVPSNDQPGPDSVRSQFEEQEFSPFADTEFEVVEGMNNVNPTDDSLAFGEATTTTGAGFDDAFGDSFTAPTQLQVDDFSKEPFQSFNETVDAVLDGDESVFDPNSPISPVDFKAIPDDAGVTGIQSQLNLSTSDISISSHVDSLDDDGPSSLPDSLPDKLPELVDPPSIEKQAATEDVKTNSLAGYRNGATDVENVISNADENVMVKIGHVSIGAGAVVTDPTHTGNESFSKASQDSSGIHVDESPDTRFQNSVSHHHMADTEVRTQDTNNFCEIGNNEGDLHETVSVSIVATVSSTVDGKMLPSPGEIQSAPIEDQQTSHQDIVDRLEIKKNISEQSHDITSAMEPGLSASGNFCNDTAQGPAISHNDDASQAHTDKENFSEIAPDRNSNNLSVYDMARDNVHLYENVSYNDGRDPASSIAATSDKTVASTSQFPPPNNTHHDIENNSEIPPIYEEPPKDDDPIHDLSSSSSNNHPRLPQNYLFSVQALYKYRSTDDDELSFNKGDIIHIVVHPDPEEQDEGWQLGVRQIDWEENGENASMGVFPENFTKGIEL